MKDGSSKEDCCWRYVTICFWSVSQSLQLYHLTGENMIRNFCSPSSWKLLRFVRNRFQTTITRQFNRDTKYGKARPERSNETIRASLWSATCSFVDFPSSLGDGRLQKIIVTSKFKEFSKYRIKWGWWHILRCGWSGCLQDLQFKPAAWITEVIPGQKIKDQARASMTEIPWWAECRIASAIERNDCGRTTLSSYMRTPP